MGTLTTPDMVRLTLGASDPLLTNQALNQYIAFAENIIQWTLKRTFIPSDGDYETAQAVATWHAAMQAIIRPQGGTIDGLDYKIDELQIKKSSQQEARLKTAAQFRVNIREGMAALKQEINDVPISTTQGFG